MRPKTEEEKTAASERQKRHWRRCDAWGETLGISKMEINDHWSCCVKPKLAGGVPEVRRAYTEHMARKSKSAEEHAALCHRLRADQQRYDATARLPKREKREKKVPPLDQRIKIMLWSIRTCGGAENAQDALELAIRSLEDE